MEIVESNNTLEDQVQSLKNVIQKLQIEKQAEESKSAKLTNLHVKQYLHIEELNRLVAEMQKENDDLK